MKRLRTAIILAVVCLNIPLAFWLHSAKTENRRLISRLDESQAAAANKQSILKTKDETIELLSEKVGQLTHALTNATAQLRVASERIRGYEVVAEANDKAALESQRLIAEVPAPTTSVGRDEFGAEIKALVFPKVLDSRGRLLATNAPFSKQYGRRLVFRPEAGPFAVDVDDVHPAILQYLGIGADDAKEKQKRMDAAWRAKEVADYQQFLTDQQLREQRRESDERLAIQRAQTQAEIEKMQAEQRVKLEAAQNERMKAEAAAKAADAAMIQALNPSWSTVVVPRPPRPNVLR